MTVAGLGLTAFNARYYLLGDEDGGVHLGCRDCWAGGRPIAYYDSTNRSRPPYIEDPLVENVAMITDLLSAADRHEHKEHG